MHHDHILILDFGSQVTQLIARRVREHGVYCEIWPFNHADEERIRNYNPKGIILGGGPASVTDEGSPRAPSCVFEMGIPVLGICYGQQTMMEQLGGKVEKQDFHEYGRAEIKVTAHCALFGSIWTEGSTPTVWMSHGDRVTKMPEGFDIVATSKGAPYAIVADESRHYYGIQFHPEVMHTQNGSEIIRNFVIDIAGCKGDWTMAVYKDEAIAKIREQVGTEKVICGLSGGVDSSVAAVLIHEAIGDQLTCIYVDTGMMRKGESDQVVKLFRDHYNIPLIHEDASNVFLGKLEGVSDPEKKRKIIGGTFIDVFDECASRIGGSQWLAQGTLYPDVIESVSYTGGPSVTIKSHHNVGGLPEKMNLKILEPLRELFKDEVRDLGRTLGLHDDFVSRHPFPGPGLAVRCPGEITKEKLDILREADAVYLDAIREEGLYNEIWQAFVVLLPVRTVGVMGDGRTYDYACALRAVTSTDGMTADFYQFEMDFLSRVATRIINEVRGINRVTYDITSKPPGTIEWE